MKSTKKTYEPMECKLPQCRKIFTPRHFNQVYCCAECYEEATNERKREFRRKRRIEENEKKMRKKSSKAWDDINAFMENYTQETGKFITYGKAVLLMEQQKGR